MRPPPPPASEISPTIVQDAIVQIMHSGLGRGHPVDVTMARDMAGRLTPAVQKMGLHAASSAVLSGNSAFHSLVAQHLGSPAGAVYDPAFRLQLQQSLDRANIHGPEYLAGVRDGMRLGLLAAGRDNGHAPHAGDRRSYERDLPASGSISAASLPLNLRGYVTEGVSAAHVASTANYLERLGITPGAYTGHFLGTSQSFRTALADHVAAKRHLTDNDIKKREDIAGSIAAYQTGKITDAHLERMPGLKKTIQRMKEQKIDLEDTNSVKKYLDRNKGELKQIQEEAAKQQKQAAGLTPDAKSDARAALKAPQPAAPATPTPKDKPKPKVDAANVKL